MIVATERPKLVTVPADWLQAANCFAELRYRLPLDNDEWDVLITWLRQATFDSRSFLAGEVAAGLVRDHAPMHVKDLFLADDPADEWQRHFQKIAVSRFRPLLGIDQSGDQSVQFDSSAQLPNRLGATESAMSTSPLMHTFLDADKSEQNLEMESLSRDDEQPGLRSVDEDFQLSDVNEHLEERYRNFRGWVDRGPTLCERIGCLPEGAVSIVSQGTTWTLRASHQLQKRFEELLERRKAGLETTNDVQEFDAICGLDLLLSDFNRLARRVRHE